MANQTALSMVFLASALSSSGSFAQSVGDQIATVDGALVCLRPTEIMEAFQAALAADEKWLRSLGCATVRGGIPAILIEVETEVYGVWKVRLRPTDTDGVTMYGLLCVFIDPKTGIDFCRAELKAR